MAAFRSLSMAIPQHSQWYVLTDSGSSDLTFPHIEQVRDVL